MGVTPERLEYDRKVLAIREKYKHILGFPPDANALSSYAREFRELGSPPNVEAPVRPA